jgi:hypothetical protein
MKATGGISKASWGSLHSFPEGFRKAVCSSHAALEQLLHTSKRVKGNMGNL